MIRSRIVNPADLASLTKRVLRGWITGNLSSRRACTGSNHTEKKSDEEQVFLLIYIPLHKNLALSIDVVLQYRTHLALRLLQAE